MKRRIETPQTHCPQCQAECGEDDMYAHWFPPPGRSTHYWFYECPKCHILFRLASDGTREIGADDYFASLETQTARKGKGG